MRKGIKFSTRMASADREKIRALAAKAHMSMNDYVIGLEKATGKLSEVSAALRSVMEGR